MAATRGEVGGTAQEVARHLRTLQKKLSREQFLWAIGGAVIVDFGAPTMRQELGGVVAGTDTHLHFFRKSMLGGTHMSLPLGVVTSIETAAVPFGAHEIEMVLLNQADAPRPWAIATDEEQRRFLLAKLEQTGGLALPGRRLDVEGVG